jgi:hypothetical protein
LESAEERLGKESLNQAEDSCHELEAMAHLVGLLRKGYRLDTDGWLRLLQEIRTVWPVSSKGHFRLWQVADFPSNTSER